MSMKRWAGISVMLLVIVGFVFAEAQQQDQAERQTPRRVRSMGDARGTRLQMSREQLYQERLARQAEEHRAEIQELAAIKKIAETENATKTAEAIQALIDKKNAEYQKGIQQVERARRERAERLAQRRQRLEDRQDQDQPETERPQGPNRRRQNAEREND